MEGRGIPMLAHTHGQPATPTTIGKEFAVFVARARAGARADRGGRVPRQVQRRDRHLRRARRRRRRRRLARALARVRHLARPRLEPAHHPDRVARLAGGAVRARSATLNRILHNLCTDIWTYISMGYLAQIPQAGATGSSTMPHKINPIRFENAEANFELSSALLDSLAATLVTSRLQRDLTDSTTQRNIGVALGHSLLALDNLARGLGEIAIARDCARRRPRRQLGGARRGDPDRDPRRGDRRAQLDRRPVRAAQGADARQAGRRRTSSGVRRRPRHRRRREGAPARAHARRPTSGSPTSWSTTWTSAAAQASRRGRRGRRLRRRRRRALRRHREQQHREDDQRHDERDAGELGREHEVAGAEEGDDAGDGGERRGEPEQLGGRVRSRRVRLGHDDARRRGRRIGGAPAPRFGDAAAIASSTPVTIAPAAEHPDDDDRRGEHALDTLVAGERGRRCPAA